MKNNFYKIGFFILLALILMGASTVGNFTNVTPVAPKTIMTYRGDVYGSEKLIQEYHKKGYILKTSAAYTRATYYPEILIVMEKY